jgi:hypothetical protein
MLAPRAQFRGPVMATVSLSALILACILAVGVAATGARANDVGNHLYDRYQFGLSGSELWLSDKARVDTEDGSRGTDLDIAEDLGFTTNRFQPRLSFRWRPGHRHEIEAGYQFARRSADKTLGRTISVGDTSFAAGLEVHSVFNTDNAAITYRYAIMAHERTQLGAALGLGAFFLKVGVDGRASASSGGQSASADYGVSESFMAPTLAIGLFGRFRVGDRWYIAPDVRYLQFTIDRYTPRILEGGLIGQYYLSNKVGIEAGFGLRGLRLDIGPSSKDSLIDLGFTGMVKYSESQARLGLVLAL